MIRIFRKIAPAGLALALSLGLAGCGGMEGVTPTRAPAAVVTVPTTEATVPKEEIRELALVLEAGQLYTLNSYPNLERVDLTGSTCYEAILDYMGKHPNLEVTFAVDVGGSLIFNRDSSAQLEPERFDYEILMENLQYLPELKTLSLPGIRLSAEQIDGLLERYPELALDYTVELFGSTYGQETTELDLSGMTSDQAGEAAKKLGLLTHLTDVQLGSQLSLADVAMLQDGAERTTFHYSFSLFGKTVSTTDTEIIYKGQTIGDGAVEELRSALSVLDGCERFVLDGCGLSNETLAQLREEFRDGPKVVWRVYFGDNNRYTQLTDDEMLRAVYHVTDETCGPMRYCEGVKYMDIGHNEYLTDLSFVGYMPDLEVLIASGSAVKELPENIGNCKKLTWLELASCLKLDNIDALEGCEGLRFLNISYSKVTSYASLDSLPLERFVALNPRASTKEQNTFVALHDGCRTAFYGYSNPWTPWRYDDNGKTFNAYYKDVVREAFDYDRLEQYLPKD